MKDFTLSSSEILTPNQNQPSETTPLLSSTGAGHKRLKAYIRTFNRCSSKRRQRLSTSFHRDSDISDATEVAENSSSDSVSEIRSFSTLAPSIPGRDSSPNSKCQSSCEVSSSQTNSLRSSSPLRNCDETFLSSISLTLENQGSVARDHLASERTFLAYVRTSLAIASAGVALVQLFTIASANLRHYPTHRLHTYILPLGAVTIVMGMIVLIIGVVRYFSVQVALTRGNFPVARVGTIFISVILLSLVTIAFSILLAGKLVPPTPEV